MSITTGVASLADAQARLQQWLDADEAVSKGQSFAIADRSLTRADVRQIAERIAYWQGQVRAFAAKAAGARSPGIAVAAWKG